MNPSTLQRLARLVQFARGDYLLKNPKIRATTTGPAGLVHMAVLRRDYTAARQALSHRMGAPMPEWMARSLVDGRRKQLAQEIIKTRRVTRN